MTDILILLGATIAIFGVMGLVLHLSRYKKAGRGCCSVGPVKTRHSTQGRCGTDSCHCR